jgi:hypothetical protein
MDAILMTLTILSLAAAAVFAHTAWRARRDAAERSAARVAALASALGAAPQSGIGESEFQTRPDPMFATTATNGRALTAPAIAAAIGAVLLVTGGAVLRHETPPAADGSSGASPLELVSMRHARGEGTLTVTGLVRNPPDGASLAGVAALVFAFGRSGEFAGSGQGPLDLPALRPGEEAPFVVRVTDLPDIGRYRVSFRTTAGPLRHVDRRAARRPISAR